MVDEPVMRDDDSELARKFRQFDTDGNGAIGENEFAALVKALGLSFSPEEVQIAFSAIDINGNGRIDFGEFKNWWSKR